jgi:hypothetical protein
MSALRARLVRPCAVPTCKSGNLDEVDFVRAWRTPDDDRLLWMQGVTTRYRVDPVGEYVIGVACRRSYISPAADRSLWCDLTNWWYLIRRSPTRVRPPNRDRGRVACSSSNSQMCRTRRSTLTMPGSISTFLIRSWETLGSQAGSSRCTNRWKIRHRRWNDKARSCHSSRTCARAPHRASTRHEWSATTRRCNGRASASARISLETSHWRNCQRSRERRSTGSCAFSRPRSVYLPTPSRSASGSCELAASSNEACPPHKSPSSPGSSTRAICTGTSHVASA